MSRNTSGRGRRRIGAAAPLIGILIALGGCGALDFVGQSDYSDQLVGSTGNAVSRAEIDAIAADSSLTDDERRTAYQELGIEDEDLIDALLANNGTTGTEN